MLMQREAKTNGGKKGKNAQASKSRKQGELAIKTATQRQDNEVCCENCGQVYVDAESDSWIGCKMWWHYWCAGFQSMLSEEDEWFCEYCLSH